MRQALVDLTEEQRVQTGILDMQLSFDKFIAYLQDRAGRETKVKKNFFGYVLQKFTANPHFRDIIPLDQVQHLEEELELMYNLLQPPLNDENEILWGLSMPVEPVMFYGTDAFYRFLSKEADTRALKDSMAMEDHLRQSLRLIYQLIYAKIFDTDGSSVFELKHAMPVSDGGIVKFYKVNLDARFIDVLIKKPLPEIDKERLAHDIIDEDFKWHSAMRRLPLDHFTFRGVGVITVEDISKEQAVENIKSLVLNRTAHSNPYYNESLQQTLKSLLGSTNIEIGVLPNLRVNDNLVFSTREGAVFTPWIAKNRKGNEKAISVFFEEYLGKSKTVVLEGDNIPEHLMEFLENLAEAHICSYVLIPVFHSNKLAGALEIFSRERLCTSKDKLTNMEVVLPIIAQLLQDRIDEFNSAIGNIIMEKFTALQPAVQWKFNEVAWNYLKEHAGAEKPGGIERIAFQDVHPLYGAIDIRNSTEERNRALTLDLDFQLSEAIKTLAAAKAATGLALIDELSYQCVQWHNRIMAHYNDADARMLGDFLEQQVAPLLQHLSLSHPQLKPAIGQYFETTYEDSGGAFAKRRHLEQSIHAINAEISKHLDAFNNELQQIFPVYFEKFRTDGLEYDIYLGQSIATDRVYDPVYLKNVRLLQLQSMVTIARQIKALCIEQKFELEVTQLIYVRSQPIDIVFRPDERKFDVEGSYNIRYQVVKKRIDKVHLKNSAERLTQPGKICLVYFNKTEADEYTAYIEYLQSQGLLADDLEYLELEELQGVYGLKALRVGVCY